MLNNPKQALLKLLVLFLMLCGHQQASGQMWPGDANNDGIVNGADAFYVGIAFGATGSQRDSTSIAWEAKTLPTLWNDTFPNGLNYAYADCNGDGAINAEDFVAIEVNRHKVQNDGVNYFFPGPGNPGEDPPLEIKDCPDNVVEFTDLDTLKIPFTLGSSKIPLDSFYGFTFKIHFDTTFHKVVNFLEIKPDFVNASAENEALPFYNVSEVYETLPGGNTTLEISFTLANQLNTKKYNEFVLFIIIEDNVILSVAPNDTLPIILDSVYAMDNKLQVQPLVSTYLDLVYKGGSKSEEGELGNGKGKGKAKAKGKDGEGRQSEFEEWQPSSSLTIAPNPAYDRVWLTSENKMERIEVFNHLGQQMLYEKFDENPIYQKQISVESWRPGPYYIRVREENGYQTKKIIVHRDY